MKVFAIAGPVLDHTRLTVDGFPAVVTTQAQDIAVADHHAFGITEAAHRIAVAVDHFAQLAVFAVAILNEGFDGFIAHYALDVSQPTKQIVVLQMHTRPAGGADVGKRTVGGWGEMQIMPQRIFQTLQGHLCVVVRHFAEVQEGVIEGLQEVVTAERSDQINLFVGVVDTFARLNVDKGHAAALIVGEVNKAATAAQALFPRQRKPRPSTLSMARSLLHGAKAFLTLKNIYWFSLI